MVLALGSAATAPGARPLAILVPFLATVCWVVPVLVRREDPGADGLRMRVVGRFASRAWLPHLAAAGLTLAGLLGGLALYLFVPRLESRADEAEARSELGIRGRTAAGAARGSGFARTIKLGDIGRIKRDDRLAFEAQLTYYGRPYDPPPSRSTMLLLRARAWNRYDPDRGEWTRTLGRLARLESDGLIERGTTPVDWRLDMLGYDGRTLFLPQRARRIRSEGVGLLRDPVGTVVAERELRRYGVEAGDPVTSGVDVRRLEPNRQDPIHLDVPPSLRDLLAAMLPPHEGLRVDEKIALVRQIFTQGGFRYTLDLPPSLPDDADPIAAFLERREGHCELFASTGCLLLRLMGVPARIAGGIRLDERAAPGRYRARYRNAHAWVEIRFHVAGFVAFDFTPPDRRAVVPSAELAGGTESAATPGIDERGGDAEGAGDEPAFDWGDPLRFDRADQARLRRRVGDALAVLVAPRVLQGMGLLLLLFTGAVLARGRLRRVRRSPLRVRAPAGRSARAFAFYARWLKRCAAKGHRRRAHQTPREFLAMLPPELRRDGDAITARFEELRYGS